MWPRWRKTSFLRSGATNSGIQGRSYPRWMQDPHHHDALSAIRSWGLDVLQRKEWPAHSPDFNIIENLWGYAKQAVNKELSGDLSASVAAKQNLEAGIVEMWRTHPQVQVNNLLASFPRRLKAVVDLEGKNTKY